MISFSRHATGAAAKKIKRRVISDDEEEENAVNTSAGTSRSTILNKRKKERIEGMKRKLAAKDFLDDEAEEVHEEEEAPENVEEEEEEVGEEEQEEEEEVEEEEEEEEEDEEDQPMEEEHEEEEEEDEEVITLEHNKIEAEVEANEKKRRMALKRRMNATKVKGDKTDEDDRAWTQSVLEQLKSTNQDNMVDMSPTKAAKVLKPIVIALGEGFRMERGMVSFTTGGQQGSFEAISIYKTLTADDKVAKTRDLVIHYPIRCLDAVRNSIAAIRKGIDLMPKLPTQQEMYFSTTHSNFDLTEFASSLPKLAFKVDELYTIASENMKWGKASVDVVTFTKLPKEKAKKNFALQIPFRLFKSLELAVDYLYSYPEMAAQYQPTEQERLDADTIRIQKQKK